MKIAEKKFERDMIGGWAYKTRSNRCNPWICDVQLKILFNIPESVKVIWLSLHSRPAMDRVEVCIKEDSCCIPPLPMLVIKEINTEWNDGGAFDRILRPLIGKTLYLQCEYEQ